MRAGIRGIAAATLVPITIAGCQVADDPTDLASSGGDGPTSVIADIRKASLALPAGFDLQQVEFADASNGYAAFWTEDPVNLATTKDPEQFRYASAVFATSDAGRTWRRLKDPRAPSFVPQMYTVDAQTIALEAQPDGWYVSRDGGATFRFDAGMREPPEVASYLSSGTYRLECEGGCRIVGKTQTQPGLPGELGAVTEASGAVWAASLDGTLAYSAFSRDQGRTWQRRDVPSHPVGVPARLTMSVSADGRDVWLVGFPGGGFGGLGSVAPVRRKDVGVPLLWLLEGDRWVPKGTLNPPIPSMQPYSVSAIGGGLAAVAGPGVGLALVDTAWHAVEMSPRVEYLTTLRDGTVFAANHHDRTFLSRCAHRS